MAGRQMPTTRTIGRAGNYAAPVDTAGMDSEMKATLGMGAKKMAPKKPGFMDMMKGLLKKKGKK